MIDEVVALRAYLLGGMILHKLVWEWMRYGQPPTPAVRRYAPVKIAKLCVLLGFLVQTLLPEILPISDDPQTIRWVGCAVYTLGLVVAITGRLQLGKNWSNIEDATVLKEQRVVDHGIYSLVRHPIYSGDMLLVTGLELALNSWLVLGVPLLFLMTRSKVIQEEGMLRKQLPGYEAYCARTGRFFPGLH